MILMAVAAVTIASCYDPYHADEVCSGSGSCYDPELCCDVYGSDCYYYADSETFWCDGSYCDVAYDDMAYYCGY